jgi:hypothetical protein
MITRDFHLTIGLTTMGVLLQKRIQMMSPCLAAFGAMPMRPSEVVINLLCV